MLTSIVLTLFFNNVLFFIENYQELKISKKIVTIWGICSMILSGLCSFFLLEQITDSMMIGILITGIIGTKINLSVHENLELQKKYTKSLFVIFLFFFYSLIQYIPILMFHIDIENISLETESYLDLFSRVVFAIALIFIYRKELQEEWNRFKKEKMKYLDTGFKYWVIGFVVMSVSNILIHLLLPKAIAGNEESIQSLIKVSPFVSLISAGILAPIIEEITFRKAFRNMIQNDTLFIWVSGLIFGSLHVVFSLNSIYDIAYLIPYCSLGISFGYMYVKTKTVFTSLSVHTIHNLVATAFSIATALVILC